MLGFFIRSKRYNKVMYIVTTIFAVQEQAIL